MYFESEGGKRLGQVACASCTCTRLRPAQIGGHDWCFQLVARKKKMTLQAPSEAEMVMWLSAFERCGRPVSPASPSLSPRGHFGTRDSTASFSVRRSSIGAPPSRSASLLDDEGGARPSADTGSPSRAGAGAPQGTQVAAVAGAGAGAGAGAAAAAADSAAAKFNVSASTAARLVAVARADAAADGTPAGVGEHDFVKPTASVTY